MEFWQVADPLHPAIRASWDLRLVLLSYIVASVASYTALDLADRMIETRHLAVRRVWLASGSFAMGVGIWSMHFTGMLAFDMRMPVSYGWTFTLLSMLVAILASGFALFIVSRETFSRSSLLLGGSVMGVGIVSMHYIGMEAMRMPAELSYDPYLVGLSVLIAVGASLTALYLASRFSRGEARALRLVLLKLMSSAVMGGAIVGMHYTGMWAATFTPTGEAADEGTSQILLGASIGSVTLVILGIALISSMVDRRFALQATYLDASERRYESLFEQNPDAVFVMDLDGRFTSVNHAAMDMVGSTEARILGSHSGTFAVPESKETVLENFEKAASGEPQNFEAAITVRDGRHVDLNLTYMPMIVEDEIKGVFGIGKDITDRKELERELERRATSDPLTGLPNRALFTDLLERGLARAHRRNEPLAVLFLDLDNFKYVNDSLGHEVGDKLLVEVADNIRKSLRETDTAARIGGDEFAVLLEDVEDEAGAARVAQRISDSLQAPSCLQGHEVRTTFSIGVALGVSNKENPGELLRNADTAMYQAKNNGKNRHQIFQPRFKDEARGRLELEGALRYAIEEDQLTVYYQPKVWIEDGTIYGAEALVRWERPGHGLISPGDFIPLAEKTGLIVPLGRQVLEKACSQLQEWQERYPDRSSLTVSVNVSPKQFSDGALVGDVARVLRETGVRPHTLTLEITESSVMEDAESNRDTLRSLKDLGVCVSIDDFGKGYSSLTYLKDLPVDILKIDRAFIDGLDSDTGNMAITSAIITLARALGLKVVAEGVETIEQLANLQELGGDLAQGFYFSKPLPAQEMGRLLESNAPLGESDARRATRAFGYFAQSKQASGRADLLNRAIAVTTSGVVITDNTRPHDPIIYFNETFEKITGYSAEDALGYNCRFLQGTDTDQPELDGLREAISEGREHSCVLRNYRKDGTMFWNELIISPVHDKDGGITNFIGIQNDVTDRVRREQETQGSEERLRAMLIEYSSDIITVLEPDGTIRYQSPASESVLGYLPEELCGLTAFDMIHPEDQKRAYEELSGVLANPGTTSRPIELRYLHADGSWRYMEALASNLLGDPRVEGIVVNSRDITHRKTSGADNPGSGWITAEA